MAEEYLVKLNSEELALLKQTYKKEFDVEPIEPKVAKR